jgi:hypothetical protein
MNNQSLFTLILILLLSDCSLSQELKLIIRPCFPTGITQTSIPVSRSNTFRAGSGAAIEGGLGYQLTNSISIQSTIGYNYTYPGIIGELLNFESSIKTQFSSIFGTIGAYYELETNSSILGRIRIGAGINRYFPNQLKFESGFNIIRAEYEDATGYYLDIGKVLQIKESFSVDVSFRYRRLIYELSSYDSPNSPSPDLVNLDASAIELAATFYYTFGR